MLRAALLAAALLTCGGHVEQRTDVIMGGWDIRVGDQAGKMLLIAQGPGACGVFRLGKATGYVYGLEAEAGDDGVRASFTLGGFEVHATRQSASGVFAGTAWRDEYLSESFAAVRNGAGGGPGHPAQP